MEILTPDLIEKVLIMTFGNVANRKRVRQERSVRTSTDSRKIIGRGYTNFHARTPCFGSFVVARGIATPESFSVGHNCS
jgi:hypothetical protein